MFMIQLTLAIAVLDNGTQPSPTGTKGLLNLRQPVLQGVPKKIFASLVDFLQPNRVGKSFGSKHHVFIKKRHHGVFL
jgi:hypothetical protein